MKGIPPKENIACRERHEKRFDEKQKEAVRFNVGDEVVVQDAQKAGSGKKRFDEKQKEAVRFNVGDEVVVQDAQKAGSGN
ncbi:hypothetical protein QE152_g1982 [Popillia japonica]|uniref:Uncharacterized protein n=1 Tax=Popillia japonica TaxID=7064 RepID=A0AAW1N4P5_POPJA